MRSLLWSSRCARPQGGVTEPHLGGWPSAEAPAGPSPLRAPPGSSAAVRSLCPPCWKGLLPGAHPTEEAPPVTRAQAVRSGPVTCPLFLTRSCWENCSVGSRVSVPPGWTQCCLQVHTGAGRQASWSCHQLCEVPLRGVPVLNPPGRSAWPVPWCGAWAGQARPAGWSPVRGEHCIGRRQTWRTSHPL